MLTEQELELVREFIRTELNHEDWLARFRELMEQMIERRKRKEALSVWGGRH